MILYEYKIVTFDYSHDKDQMEALLNLCGEDGWELVSVTDRMVAFFKRPLVCNHLDTTKIDESDNLEFHACNKCGVRFTTFKGDGEEF